MGYFSDVALELVYNAINGKWQGEGYYYISNMINPNENVFEYFYDIEQLFDEVQDVICRGMVIDDKPIVEYWSVDD